MYDALPRSPYSHGRFFADWKKVVCWPRVNHTRLYYMLYLKSWDKETFDKLREVSDDKCLPSEMIEPSYKLY